jgi:hypothetical protein
MTHDDEINYMFDVIFYRLSTFESLIGQLLGVQDLVSTLMYHF